jgi:hypothetical protein
MLIAGLITWWYGAGWRRQFDALQLRVDGVVDYFSIDLLFRTFFAPFRQISAGKVSGSVEAQLRAFFDRIISRLIGALVRSVMICVGTVMIIAYVSIGSIALIGWATIPLLPFVGLILWIAKWMPWV